MSVVIVKEAARWTERIERGKFQRDVSRFLDRARPTMAVQVSGGVAWICAVHFDPIGEERLGELDGEHVECALRCTVA